MSEIIEFAKILRRKAASHLDDGVKPADIAAAIAEYESTRGRETSGQAGANIPVGTDAGSHPAPKPTFINYVVLCPMGHAVKYRRDDEEGVIHVEYCDRCEESRGRVVAEDVATSGGGFGSVPPTPSASSDVIYQDGERSLRALADPHPAPSPSLDEARKRWEEMCPPVPDSAYDYIAALEQALRGIQRTMLAVLYMAAVACAWTLIVLVIVATTGCAP